MKLVSCGKTDMGRKRAHNEDNFLVDDELRLYAVADGMGGHRGGETASRLALEVLHRVVQDSAKRGQKQRPKRKRRKTETKLRHQTEATQPISRELVLKTAAARKKVGLDGESVQLDPATADASEVISAMRQAAREAAREIFSAATKNSKLRGMGTTLTAMLYSEGSMYIIHAGDSRAFLFRNGAICQLTEDHSWIWEQVKAGAMTEEEAKESKFKHIITRSVGFERNVEVDCAKVLVQPGDCFLLCSDGMSNYVENEELEQILGRTFFHSCPQHLIDVANERGGDDNITVLTVWAVNEEDGDERERPAIVPAAIEESDQTEETEPGPDPYEDTLEFEP